MSSAPPPWESHPPLSDGFYEAHPDEDTGPLHVVSAADEEWPQIDDPSPPRAEDTFAGRFTAPLMVHPRSVPVRHKRIRPGLIVGGVTAVLAVGLALS